jgi:hypothetical protein
VVVELADPVYDSLAVTSAATGRNKSTEVNRALGVYAAARHVAPDEGEVLIVRSSLLTRVVCRLAGPVARVETR